MGSREGVGPLIVPALPDPVLDQTSGQVLAL